MNRSLYEKRLKTIVDILAEFKPKRIYAFGSYEWGNAHKDSDIDLAMIVVEGTDILKIKTDFALGQLEGRYKIDSDPDLKIIEENVFSYRLAQGDPFVNDIAKGRIVYESK